MSDDQEFYATPKSELMPSGTSAGIEAFKRMSAWLVFGLTLITAGIYGVYWLATRSKVINTIQDRKISELVINGLLISYIASTVMSIVIEFQPDNLAYLSLSAISSIVYVVFYIVLVFAFRSRLRAVTNDTPNGILAFFFSAIYFQFKINQAMDQR